MMERVLMARQRREAEKMEGKGNEELVANLTWGLDPREVRNGISKDHTLGVATGSHRRRLHHHPKLRWQLVVITMSMERG